MLDKAIIMYHDLKLRKTTTNRVEVWASSGVSGDMLTVFRKKHGEVISEFKKSRDESMDIRLKYFWSNGKQKLLISYNGNEPEGF